MDLLYFGLYYRVASWFAELERDVIGLYGGVAAEELFYGARGISVGSQNDIEKITKMLSLMVGRQSVAKPKTPSSTVCTT